MKDVRKKYDAHYKREENEKNITKTKENTSITEKTTKEKLQWHPAFFADMQIEFEEESYNLVFENEHQLGTMPKEIDVLVIKKDKNIPVRKNIGRIFRKYNIIEYKSPDDSFGINDFYKVMGYTYFYKADTRKQNMIKLEDITVTFVSKRYPRKMVKHLRKKGKIIKKVDDGIWYVKGVAVPVQIIVTSKLSKEKNFWMKNFTNDLKDKRIADEVIERYAKHKDDIYYRSVMDIIVRANRKIFEEGNTMCDAMMEILKDRIDEMNRESKKEGLMLAKRIIRMNADGVDNETIASKCCISVKEVSEILAF